MPAVKIELIPQFKGEGVVLLAMDQNGLAVVRSALLSAQQGLVSKTAASAVAMEFRPEADQAVIDLKASPIIWRLSSQKICEIVEKLDAMRALSGPCHHYVDITEPTKTLVLAKDEYL
jgi:hypothetical protein